MFLDQYWSELSVNILENFYGTKFFESTIIWGSSGYAVIGIAFFLNLADFLLNFCKNDRYQHTLCDVKKLLLLLLLSDSFLCIVLAVGTMLETWTPDVDNIVGVFYTSSVLLTLGITLDRYMKV